MEKKEKKSLNKKRRLLKRNADNTRKVFDGCINDRSLALFQLQKRPILGAEGTLTRLKLLEQAALGNIFIFCGPAQGGEATRPTLQVSLPSLDDTVPSWILLGGDAYAC